jgi:hypothetical protein
VLPDEFDIERGPERFKPRLVEMYASPEKRLLGAKNNDAGVDEFLAVNAGNDP